MKERDIKCVYWLTREAQTKNPLPQPRAFTKMGELQGMMIEKD